MFVQFLVEDQSTEVLLLRIMNKLQETYQDVYYDIKSFKGIGRLGKAGTVSERKTGQLLNDLPQYLRAFNSKLLVMKNEAALFIILDNDYRDPKMFREQLALLSETNSILIDHVYCIAVKEMEAWLLGDEKAIEEAYPQVKKKALEGYEQDALMETWEYLANATYPGGLKGLKKKAGLYYTEIGKAKAEWADRIGEHLHLSDNMSPSFNYFMGELVKRIGRGRPAFGKG